VSATERDEPGRELPGARLGEPETGVDETGAAVDPHRHAALDEDVGHGVVEHERGELLELQRVGVAAEPGGQERPRQERRAVGAMAVHGGTVGGPHTVSPDQAAVCGGSVDWLSA
jgi:hypothetical protein